MNDDALMSTRDVARALGTSVPTVNRHARNGALPFATKAPGSRGAYMFDPKVIEALAAERAR